VSALASDAPQGSEERRRPVVPSALLGMLIFVVTELMFFAGMMSAFTISRANSLPGMWPPPGQPRFPAEATAFNTSLLLGSGAVLLWAGRRYAKRPVLAMPPLVVTVLMGAAFIGLQGREWWGLLAAGLTLTSSAMGSFFYLIVGGHALHALFALTGLSVAAWRLRVGRLTEGFFFAAQTFWFFVVVLWPVIYARLYF
jgi:cytochrome c oxidase subunit 3